MKNFHIISIALIALIFIITGVWKYASNAEDELISNDSNRENIASSRLFWNHFNKASAFMNEGIYDSAAVYYENALSFNNQHEGALYNLGNARLFLRDFDEAKSNWQKVIQLNPNSARGRLQLGTLYFCLEVGNNQFNPELAKHHFIEAHRLNREETGHPLHLSKIALIGSNLNKAEEYLEMVLASNFMSYQALFLRGFIDWKRNSDSSGTEMLSGARDLFSRVTQVTMAGEGATSSGFRPMLSEDMYCDFFGNRIEELLSSITDISTDSVYGQFEQDLLNWQNK